MVSASRPHHYDREPRSLSSDLSRRGRQSSPSCSCLRVPGWARLLSMSARGWKTGSRTDSRSEEMAPRWFGVDELPYDQMVRDWPYVSRGGLMAVA